MTVEEMDKINELNRAYHQRNKVVALSGLINDMKSIGAMSYENDGSVKTTKENTSEVKVSRVIELTETLEKDLEMLDKSLCDVYNDIKKVNDAELEAILINRYLRFMPFEQISEKMHMSESTVYRKHRVAIKKLTVNDIV